VTASAWSAVVQVISAVAKCSTVSLRCSKPVLEIDPGRGVSKASGLWFVN
jgi:hypothetical protein